jgi:dihydroorotate dehydrogenase electron transfer subunit
MNNIAVGNYEIPADFYLYKLVVAAENTAVIRPGQFAMVSVPGFFLPRPFSIAGVESDKGRFVIVYKIAGACTAALAELSGRQLDAVGVDAPLGNGWPMPDRDGRVLLVGGGIGWAPLAFLSGRLHSDTATAVIAGRTRDDLMWHIGSAGGIDAKYATDDGSYGFRGNAAQLAEEIVNKQNFDAAYVCGPDVMMRAVSEITMSVGIKTYVSLEKRMACGIGSCKTCQVDGAEDAAGLPLHVCKDGPVFRADQVFGKVR